MTKTGTSARTMSTAQPAGIDKVKERVQKLLNQAADQEGTPEAEVFYEKAFEIMATYGFSEVDLEAPDEEEPIHAVFEFRGAYTDMQARLLGNLVAALHCSAFTNTVYNSTKVHSTMVFGVRRNVERVEMLFGLLNSMMAAGARGVTGAPDLRVSTVVARRSYMTGFANSIYDRLVTAETEVAGTDKRYELMLVDDATKATRARDEYAEALNLHLTQGRRSKRSFHGESYERGLDDGGSADLGQTRVRARPALPC